LRAAIDGCCRATRDTLWTTRIGHDPNAERDHQNGVVVLCSVRHLPESEGVGEHKASCLVCSPPGVPPRFQAQQAPAARGAAWAALGVAGQEAWRVEWPAWCAVLAALRVGGDCTCAARMCTRTVGSSEGAPCGGVAAFGKSDKMMWRVCPLPTGDEARTGSRAFPATWTATQARGEADAAMRGVGAADLALERYKKSVLLRDGNNSRCGRGVWQVVSPPPSGDAWSVDHLRGFCVFDRHQLLIGRVTDSRSRLSPKDTARAVVAQIWRVLGISKDVFENLQEDIADECTARLCVPPSASLCGETGATLRRACTYSLSLSLPLSGSLSDSPAFVLSLSLSLSALELPDCLFRTHSLSLRHSDFLSPSGALCGFVRGPARSPCPSCRMFADSV
jgi:hypothetical protein